jgi:hypothetical protein
VSKEEKLVKKYRITFVESPKGSGDTGDYIYVDVNFELRKIHGIFERSRQTGQPQMYLNDKEPLPDWVIKIFKIPGVLGVHQQQFSFFVTYAPLFDRQKIARRIMAVIKAKFAKGEKLYKVETQPKKEHLLPEDLEHKLRQIIEDHFSRSRRWHLRRDKQKQPTRNEKRS